jgi:hypothetical protein
MKKFRWLWRATAIVFLVGIAFFGYQRWSEPKGAEREDLLALMPADASVIFFADFNELRRTTFFAGLYAWAPKPQADADYAQFLKETGFDYERDLGRIAIATEKNGQGSTLFVVADGNFDRQKIAAFASQDRTVTKNGGREIFSVPINGSAKKISFLFLRDDRIALTDRTDLGMLLRKMAGNRDMADWHSRFERLSGSPVFAVIRQDAAAGAALAAQAPGGLRSPQLSTLLDQLQWITLAGKPENERLRVVAEGECTAEATARQLTDLLNGIVILAEAGLNDAKTRQQLDPAMREAYMELLKSADVSKIDRGDTKSVRLVFDISPRFLEAARVASPMPSNSDPNKPLPGKTKAPKRGHI